MTGPTSDNGAMTALTRDPSGRRASTRGLDLVDPPAERGDDAVDDPEDVLVVEEDGSTRWILPPRSMYTWCGPLTMTSVIVSSASSGSSGPRPVTSSTISSTRRALVAGDREPVAVMTRSTIPSTLTADVGRVDVEQRVEGRRSPRRSGGGGDRGSAPRGPGLRVDRGPRRHDRHHRRRRPRPSGGPAEARRPASSRPCCSSSRSASRFASSCCARSTRREQRHECLP